MRFRLSARVSSANGPAVKAVLEGLLPRGTVSDVEGELVVEAELEGESATDLNRTLLSGMRKAERRTRLRAQWTAPDGTTQHFFDYVLKKTTAG